MCPDENVEIMQNCGRRALYKGDFRVKMNGID